MSFLLSLETAPIKPQPSPRYKLSRVEWLRDVPEHSKMKKFGCISVIVGSASPRPAGQRRVEHPQKRPLSWLEASRLHRAPLNRLSFAGALAALRRCAEARFQAKSKDQRQELIDRLYVDGAQDLVHHRPGRREPRAVKRRPKPYPRLTCHRHQFHGIQHHNRYYKSSRFGYNDRKSTRA